MIRKEKSRPIGRDHINGIEDFKNWPYPYRGVPSRPFYRERLLAGGSD